MKFDVIPGFRAAYRISGDEVTKVKGEDVNINMKKLVEIIRQNAKIGDEEAKKLDMGTLLGFAMILDDLGIAYMGGYIVFVDALKTNWNKVLEAFKEVVTNEN
ncbi:hypothetical protein GWK48_06565 [Metallosphaera tengchongensis]|uniref:Uncharacterized protein n=1 Tax=Metallosphaera tengchongensis TaxID=1532350 RepID=A0A6N0NY74_9CREN|nr:hypothetical protein [Metallosphaera tengchongensis]QKR00081.1 hypothetical protein GWK48_06565 [Metallosphaera tengchongensis]